MTANPTQADVAERAGVSRALVSLVLRNSPKVSEERRRAVQEAARELNYRPNAAAQHLASRRTRTLGVMLQDLHNPSYAEVVDGIQAKAEEHGLRILINTSGRRRDLDSQAIETFLQLRMDGVILIAPLSDTPTIVAAGKAVPLVVVGRTVRSPFVDSVQTSERKGGQLAAQHLIDLGHRDIVFLDTPRHTSNSSSRGRLAGYRDAMRVAGLGDRIHHVRDEAVSDAEMLESLRVQNNVPTAIFAYNDLAALSAREHLLRQGLSVPGDVSLVGYDNTFLAPLQYISLTSIDQPRTLMGQVAMELLVERIDGRTEARHEVLQPTLVVRGSSQPPRSVAEDGAKRRSLARSTVRSAQR